MEASSEPISPKRIIKTRRRAIHSCKECRDRKQRCSRSYPQPCAMCAQFSRTCIYLSFKPKPTSTSNCDGPTSMAIDNESDMRRTCLPIFDTPSASSMSLSDAEWYMSPSLGTYNDMCLQIGKLSVTQRIGGVFRPNVVQELEAVLLSKARSCSGSQGTRTDLLLSTPLVAWFKRLPLANLLNPSDSTASIDGLYFPTRSECEFLVTQYFIAVDPIAHLLYKPAFEQDLLEMFRGTSSMVAESTRALILAVCFAAAVSLPLLRTQYSLGIAKAVLVDKLRTATERCLQLGNILGTCDVKMLQAVHIYLIPQCRAEISRSHSVFVGAFMRSTQITMLGQNQALVGKSAMECQIERHLWYQLCFLDIRTAEAQGPIPTLASEDYGVQLPLNTDDVDIFKGSKATSHFIFTESTFSLIRYECYEVHRLIFRGREAMEKKKTSLQDLIDTIDCRKSHIETNYLQYLDCQIPVQKCAKVVGALLIARFDAMLLHENIPRDRLSREPYHLPLAHRLRQSALSVVENAILLETEPDLAPWAWYAGAYQQYHSLIWLLIELYQDPDLEEGPRILATADYVFGASWGLIYFDRSREILEALKKNLEAFLAAPGFSVLSEPTVRDYSQGSSLIGGVGIAVGGLEMHENVLRCDIDRFASGGPVTTNPEYSNSWWLMPYAAGDAISETDPSSFEAHIH